jgi:CubicO group peptidase (beta-lactamase class C family)
VFGLIFLTETFQLLFQHKPIFPAWSTPAYSNAGYQLIGYAIEELTGKPYENSMENLIFGPLGMTRSSVFVPSLVEGLLIPNDNTFNWSIGDAAP